MPKVREKKDFTQGPLFLPMLIFSLPLMATGLLQILYNMMDQVVVGRFSGDPGALAAVGSTSALCGTISTLAIGLSVGAGVLVAQKLGAHDERGISRTVHTAFSLSLITGVLFGLIGFFLCRPLLIAMDTKAEILDLAVLYMRIVFVGLPATVFYNFGSSILRAAGDARTPMIILALSGLLNVGLNLFFVIVCHMSVDGVAYATTASQTVSALAVWIYLAKKRGFLRFSFSLLCIDKRILWDTLRIGIPSGIQGCMFGISNILLQTGVNTFPTTTVSGSTVSASIESAAYVTINSFYQSTLTFTGQNFGAGKPERVRRILWMSSLQVFLVGSLVGWGFLAFSDQLISLFVDLSLPEASAIVLAAKERNFILLPTYCLCGLMEVLTGHLRGKGFSFLPMVSSLLFICVFRVAWLFFVFPIWQPASLTTLFFCYPLSWIISTISLLVIALWLARRKNREDLSV